ncbi:NlpC/P60 family protein [Gordonia westfalica]|uniref:NlpC/P60 family protein n=1 Tax=Gordonia westfalica TaxID=158898 RepID=A0A1H2HJN2_9ACTN|nr:NlpC/P60 family protein [Gordonia westfalica]SDU31992.1 NlpC/P60 family protein [Gordonia westfalica]
MRRGRTGASWPARVTAATAAVLICAVGAGHATAAPKKAESPVSGLINEIASVNQDIVDLDQALAVRQEDVNRAIVDFQNSLAQRRLATVAARGARTELDRAGQAVIAAQKEFDGFVRLAYQQGAEQGSMSNYVASPDPQAVLDRMKLLDQVGKKQQETIRRLQVARNQKANRVAAVEATRRQASFAAKSAEQRKRDALSAVTEAKTAISEQQERKATLVAKRDRVQKKIDSIRGYVPKKQAAGPSTRDLLSNIFPSAPSLPDLPTTNVSDNELLAIAARAAARIAVDVGSAALGMGLDMGSQMLSTIIGEQRLPQSELLNELGLGGVDLTGSSGNDSLSSRLGSGSLGSLFGGSGGGGGSGGMVRPGLRGPQAVEIVVNRALSQLGVTYAWGGGDTNGPTQGIRDGGVADSYGDYRKVGFDCSGLMIYAFAGVGIELPHYTGYQYTSGPQFPLSQMRRGDMIFYGPNASQHVALYLGDNKMVEAPQSGSVVKVSPLRTNGAMPNVVRLV